MAKILKRDLYWLMEALTVIFRQIEPFYPAVKHFLLKYKGPLVDLVADRVRVGMCFCTVPINSENCSRCKSWQMAMQKP